MAAKHDSDNDEDNVSEKEALKNARVRGAEFSAKKISCLEIKYIFLLNSSLEIVLDTLLPE
jgi:hypothetical protein